MQIFSLTPDTSVGSGGVILSLRLAHSHNPGVSGCSSTVEHFIYWKSPGHCSLVFRGSTNATEVWKMYNIGTREVEMGGG
jgi:hypothetical protein